MNIAYKGFDSNLQCRGFQYEIGKTYKHDGDVVRCAEGGFHSCENPLDIFSYYPPTSRFAVVSYGGDVDREVDEDTKIASGEITIKSEINLQDLVSRGVDWILNQVDSDNQNSTNTGNRSAATNTGYQSAATNTGTKSVALASGRDSKAKASEGGAIFLVYRDEDVNIIHARGAIAGKDVKPDVFYKLNKDGDFVEVD